MGLVVFRCDASLRIGSGHVMRCRTLARGLRRRGFESVFLCRRQPGDLIDLLKKEFRVLALSPCHRLSHEAEQITLLTGRALYAEWLGCTEERDSIESLAALAKARLKHFGWLVVDHYGLSAHWQQCMQEGLRQADGSSAGMLVLDDLADRSHQASVLMDANRLDSAASDPYRDLVSKSCTTLLGPAYALLDPLYSYLHPLLPSRTQLARVLVFFGAMDAANYASVAIKALSHERFLHLAVDVVIGRNAPHRADLENYVLQRPNTSLHVDLPSLAGLIARADLALGAAGTASWERACLGLPSLIAPVAENQKHVAIALETVGVARCLDLSASVNPVTTLQSSLLELLEAPDLLSAMSEACMHLVDGRGLARVVAFLIGPLKNLRLRPATASDLWLYYWWANDPKVRFNSFNTKSISLEQHRSWFAFRLNSPLVLLRILEDGDGLPLGQIRFERATESDTRAVISFSLDRLARGRGLSPQLLELGMAELARNWRVINDVYGEVRDENEASCRAFPRAGFQEGLSPRPGVRCFVRSACHAS